MPRRFQIVRRIARRALAPIDRFLAIEAASGVVLLVVTAVALACANSPLRSAYASLWHTPLALRLGSFSFERDVHFWISDGLMTLFFFVVGLELRREIHNGELSERKRAALPLAAAVGGMAAPALIFLALNHGRPSVRGWGIPMATDIAFAVGVLSLLGKRVPVALRVLLLALAVIDDLGAILVIGLFYSKTHIHPALAGVIVGLITPVVHGERIARTLHRWVAFGVMPLFALANAGVSFSGASLAGDSGAIFAGVSAGLIVGKPLGILSAAWLSVRLGIAELPRGLTFAQVSIVGVVGGIGFTMALFVAQLAYGEGPALESAKLAILLASGTTGLAGLALGRALLTSTNTEAHVDKAPRAAHKGDA